MRNKIGTIIFLLILYSLITQQKPMNDKALLVKQATDDHTRNPVYHQKYAEPVHTVSRQGNFKRLGSTAYTWTGYRTSTKVWPTEGRTVAVNPKKIPLGSTVYIEGLGFRIAEDTIPQKSIKRGADVDIYMGRGKESVSRAKEWGRRKVEVKVYGKE